MSDAFDESWAVVKSDGRERELIQHIVSMAMGMNDEEAGDYSGYLDGMAQSGQELSDLVRQGYQDTGGAEGGWMREGDLGAYLDDWPWGGQMDDEGIAGLEAQGVLGDDDDAYEAAMQAWLKENPYTPRPSDVYEPPQMARGEMAKIMQFLQSDPDVFQDTGYDGNMAGHYGGLSMNRPDMTEMYEPMDEGLAPLGDDFTGEYHGDDGNIRGELSKIKLMQVLRDLMGGGSI